MTRIAIFTDSFHPELGGIQDSVRLLAHALGDRAHRVRIYVPAYPGYGGHGASDLDLGPTVEIVRLMAAPLPSSTRQSRLILPTGQRWRDLAGFRPDVLHAHTFLSAGWEAVRAARRLDVPIIGTNHWAVRAFSVYAPFARGFVGAAAAGAVSRFYNQCTLVTGPSRSVLDEMRAFGLTRPSQVVSNPIDTELFRPVRDDEEKVVLRRRLGFSGPTILVAGRLAIEKSVDVLIRAFASVRKHVPDAVLAIAGEGMAQPQLRGLAYERGVAEGVRFMGRLTPTELADAYRAADTFAIASLSETQSMALLQALSTGLPAVAVRSGPLIEYVPPSAGLLAEPNDESDFAAKLVALLADRNRRGAMGAYAQRFARSFGIAAVTTQWEAIYAACRGERRDRHQHVPQESAFQP